MTATAGPRPPGRQASFRPAAWRCRCLPIVSRRTDAGGSTVVMLHGPECELPAGDRRPRVLRFVRRSSAPPTSPPPT